MIIFNSLKKLIRHSIRLTKKFWYIPTSFFGVIFLIWLFCLPKELFETPYATAIFDRNGQLLAAQIAKDGQWRFPKSDSVPDKFKKALIQFEDRTFEDHPGVSARGIGRAIKQNLGNQKRVSGGSTLTMQLMRMSRGQQSRNMWQKLIEITMATRAEWRYDKEELLQMYTSQAPMGGNVVGLEAASWRYFGRSAHQLSWAESATLAVLPNAPSLMHPGKNRKALIEKRNRLLDRLYEIKEIDKTTWELSKMEPLPEKPYPIPQEAPHLLTRVLNDGRKGTVIHSSLDLSIHQFTMESVERFYEKLSQNEIYNAAVMVMEVETGEVVAYVGNTPTDDVHGGEVDVIRAPRSTGSILKPFLYASMLESGDITPEMLVQDIPTMMGGYSPKNYHEKYDGMVQTKKALSRSLNVPLVRLLVKHGISKFHHSLKKFDFTTITKPADHYGSSIILGGAEVNMWDLVGAYGILARSQVSDDSLMLKPTYIKGERDYLSNQHYPFSKASTFLTLEAMLEVKRPDDQVNWDSFASSQHIAWKTGTSFGYRDAWAVGVTSKYVVGVWVGNAGGEGRPGIIGRQAAAPILFDVFRGLPAGEWYTKPFDDMVEVELCHKSGYLKGEHCERGVKSFLPKACAHVQVCPYHKTIHLTKEGDYQVNTSCETLENMVPVKWFELPPIAASYYRSTNPNYMDPPSFRSDCSGIERKNQMDFIYPKSDSKIYVPKNFNGEYEKVIFEARHVSASTTIFWNLDDKFIGTTKRMHQLEYNPEIGVHTLKLVDENGQAITQVFEVVGK